MIPKILIDFEKLDPEPMTDCRCRWSSKMFYRKIPTWLTPCDYDQSEKLLEVELPDGSRVWLPLGSFFGKVIFEADKILILYQQGDTEELNIVGVETVKVKRTNYLKLIFENVLPF